MKGSKPQVVTTTPDPASQAYISRLRGLASGYAFGNQFTGPNSNILDSLNYLKTMSGQGATGMAALTGDSGAAAKFMNPFYSTLNPVFDRMRTMAGSEADRNATLYGAYGGDRAAIQHAVAEQGINDQQAQTTYQGFNDAMGRASAAANLGFGANANLAQLGQYLQFLPQMFQQNNLGLLNAGLNWGTIGQQQTIPQQSSPFEQMLGLGLSIGGMGVPGGGSLMGKWLG